MRTPFDGAVRVDRARNCTLEGLEICCVGGWAIQSGALCDSHVVHCRLHHAGAGAIRTSGTGTEIASNHIHHVGLYYPSAIAVAAYASGNAGGNGIRLFRNEIHDTPYSGIAGGGTGLVIEENLISRVMLEMQDGGAIYGGMKEAILRGNVVRDVVKMGEGYGVSAYYLDEGARDCLVEKNVSIGVQRPSHNHIATNITIRDNVFVCEGDMSLSFQRSADCKLINNTLVASGSIKVSPPNAVTEWKGNRLFHNGEDKDGRPQQYNHRRRHAARGSAEANELVGNGRAGRRAARSRWRNRQRRMAGRAGTSRSNALAVERQRRPGLRSDELRRSVSLRIAQFRHLRRDADYERNRVGAG